MNLAFGTLHVAAHGQKRTIAASDSRGHSLETGPFGQDFQKLFQAGRRTLCATSGLLGLPDTYVAPLVSLLCGKPELQDSPEKLLEAIRDEMYGRIRSAFSRETVPDILSIFSAFSIRRMPDGSIDFWELNVPVTSPNGTRLIGDPEIFSRFQNAITPGPFVFNICSEVPSDLLTRINADAPDKELLRRIEGAFEGARGLSESARAEIGGPIDVAAIDASGFSWLRRKPIQLPG